MKKEHEIRVKVSTDERSAIAALARSRGLAMSTLLRTVALSQANESNNLTAKN